MSILMLYELSLVTNCLTNKDAGTEDEKIASSPHLEGSVVSPDSDNLTMGMQDLKDTAIEIWWYNSPTYNKGPFSNTVLIRGVILNKSCAITQHFYYVTSASTIDRLWHVAQESHFRSTGGLGFTDLGEMHTNGPFYYYSLASCDAHSL